LKLTQVSCPNKFELMGITGVNPARVLGNEFLENTVFKLGSTWTVLQSSYTTSNTDSNNVGSPAVSDGDLSPSGEQTRENDTNNPENRI
jgi:hypothetical protein